MRTRFRAFVTKLPHDCDESALHQFFSRWCEVRQAWVVRDKAGFSLNYGFVEVATPDDLKIALGLDNYLWNDRQIVVRMANERNRGNE